MATSRYLRNLGVAMKFLSVIAALSVSLLVGCSTSSNAADDEPTEQTQKLEEAEDESWRDDAEAFKTSTRQALDEVESELDRLAGEIQKAANEGNERTRAEIRAEIEELEARLEKIGPASREAFENARTEISAELERLRNEIEKRARQSESEE